jgi:hypothetical protein
MSGQGEHGERQLLDPLAELLIARHIAVSISDREMRSQMLASSPGLQELSERKFRCIAVVGAGASAPLLDRGKDLAKGLIRQFKVDEAAVQAERERIERITAVDPEEFEAQLSAIGQILGGDRRVRTAISELYQVRHPTIKAYELIAHLLKHRFLDAVITMNFDELLDQSLDDELGIGEYQRIVSDRDCVAVQTDERELDYIPLYLKLHGTASEPESLRFTRESYYDSPARVGTVAAELFQVPECVVVNVGFGLGSFDLHRLLAIPDKVQLFDLSMKRPQPSAKDAIVREREISQRPREPRSRLPQRKVTKKRERKTQTHFSERERGAKKRTCDQLMTGLLERIEAQGEELLKASPAVISLRTVKRHEAVVRLLGPESGVGRRLMRLPRSAEESRFSLDPKARAAKPDRVYAGYLWRRAILELTLALARGRGLVSVRSLAIDRGGHYYDAYRRHAGENAETWEDLYTLVGFKQNEDIPDVFHAIEELRAGSPRPTAEEMHKLLEIAKGKVDELSLPRIDPERLVDRVLPHIVDNPKPRDRETLLATVERLNEKSEYEIHSRDDRICAKTFSFPLTLKTISALDAYSFQLVQQAAQGENSSVDIIAETGHWLLRRNDDVIKQLAKDRRIRLIVAFLSEIDLLMKKFDGIQIAHQQPWHHNRHMVIIKDGNEPRGAIYFARHQRTPYVTPVYVHTRHDIGVLQTTFDDRWKHSNGVAGSRFDPRGDGLPLSLG